MISHVGPMSLGEHAFWFVVLSLGVFLVYNGLRVESVAQAARQGLRRWTTFVGGTLILALVFHVLSSVL